VRVFVDPELCEANGQCEIMAPDFFRLRDDDSTVEYDPSPDEDRRPEIEAAVAACPKLAISLED
jgi:ferredoxin